MYICCISRSCEMSNSMIYMSLSDTGCAVAPFSLYGFNVILQTTQAALRKPVPTVPATTTHSIAMAYRTVVMALTNSTAVGQIRHMRGYYSIVHIVIWCRYCI